jgi:hypothetical protein
MYPAAVQRGPVRLALLICFSLTLPCLQGARAQSQSPSQNPKAAPSTSDTAAQTEAQKKAAERKKRFEEQKNLLAGGGSASSGDTKHAPATDTVFWMNPIRWNLVANQTQELHVWDWRNIDVSARVSWSLSDSGIVDLQVKHHAIVTAKMPGSVSVIGQIDGHTVEAIVTVYRGEKLPSDVPPFVTSPPPNRRVGGRFRSTETVSPNRFSSAGACTNRPAALFRPGAAILIRLNGSNAVPVSCPVWEYFCAGHASR